MGGTTEAVMKVEILGSGGAFPTPSPGGTTPYHQQARELGVPYARTGPSTFVHGPGILFDTPEESRAQLLRAGITRVDACFYSHWHPDHVMGRRVWESLNHGGREWPARHRTTDIYLPEQVALDFRTMLGSWDHLAFMQEVGYVRIHELSDGESVSIGDVTVTPVRLAEDYVYAFIVEDDFSRVLVAPDELYRWRPPSSLVNLDLAVLPIGVFEFHPVTGQRLVHESDPVLREAATFMETLAIARALNAREVVFSHIEALDELDHEVLCLVAEKLRSEGLPATIAFDGLVVDLDRTP